MKVGTDSIGSELWGFFLSSHNGPRCQRQHGITLSLQKRYIIFYIIFKLSFTLSFQKHYIIFYIIFYRSISLSVGKWSTIISSEQLQKRVRKYSCPSLFLEIAKNDILFKKNRRKNFERMEFNIPKKGKIQIFCRKGLVFDENYFQNISQS